MERLRQFCGVDNETSSFKVQGVAQEDRLETSKLEQTTPKEDEEPQEFVEMWMENVEEVVDLDMLLLLYTKNAAKKEFAHTQVDERAPKDVEELLARHPGVFEPIKYSEDNAMVCHF